MKALGCSVQSGARVIGRWHPEWNEGATWGLRCPFKAYLPIVELYIHLDTDHEMAAMFYLPDDFYS